MKKIRVGIIGAGFGAKVHLPAFRSDRRCEVVGITAGTPVHAEQAAKSYSVSTAFRSWRALIQDANIDAVSIAVPGDLQPVIALSAIKNKKAVFCEKPLSTGLRPSVLLAAEARKSRLPNMIDFEFPEIPAWKKCAELLKEKVVGRLRHVAVSWDVETYANKMGLESWKTDPKKGGGALHAFVSHSFYYLEWLCGPLRRIMANLAHPAGLPGKGDTLAGIWGEFRSGVPLFLGMSSHSFLGQGHKLEFFGSKGTLVLHNPAADYVKGFELYHGSRRGNALEKVSVQDFDREPGEDGRIAAVASVAKKFIDWIQTGRPQRPNLADGLRVQRLIEAAQKSNRTGRWVRC